MSKEYEWRTGRSCKFKIYYHLVFVTKYRRTVFTDEILTRLNEIFTEACLQLEGELLEFNGEDSHIHLLVSIPPKISVAAFVGKLKGKSAYFVRQEFWNDIKNKLWGNSLWSPSYCCVSCGGASLEIIKKYIEEQNRPPSKKGIIISKRENRVSSPGGKKAQGNRKNTG